MTQTSGQTVAWYRTAHVGERGGSGWSEQSYLYALHTHRSAYSVLLLWESIQIDSVAGQTLFPVGGRVWPERFLLSRLCSQIVRNQETDGYNYQTLCDIKKESHHVQTAYLTTPLPSVLQPHPGSYLVSFPDIILLSGNETTCTSKSEPGTDKTRNGEMRNGKWETRKWRNDVPRTKEGPIGHTRVACPYLRYLEL